MKLNKENLRALAAEVIAAKKAETAAKAKKPAKAEAPTTAKPEAPKTEPATAKAPKPADDKPAAAPAKTEAPAKPAKAEAPKKAEAKKPAAAPARPLVEVAAAWERLIAEQAAEVVALVKGAGKCARPVRLVTGVAVPPAALADYRAMIARHAKARAAMRDNPATTEGVYLAALRALNGDEIAALCELGMMHSTGAAGVVAVPALRTRKAAEVWARALRAVAPGAVSVVVSVRAIAATPKPAAKPEAKPAAPAPAPAKGEKPVAAPAAPKGTGKPRKL